MIFAYEKELHVYCVMQQENDIFPVFLTPFKEYRNDPKFSDS